MPTKRRGQVQHRVLCSESTVSQVEAETRRQVVATVQHTPKPVTKKDVVDALVAVAMRHPDEVSAELLRMYGVTLEATDEDPADTPSRQSLTSDDTNGENEA